MARDLGHRGIRVNAISPGTIPTAMQLEGIQAYGATTPEEIREFQEQFILKYYPPGCADQGTEGDFAHFAAAVLENPFLNGAVLRLDGGMRM